MNAIQKYELIRPILKHEKTPRQVSKEKNIPLVTIYRYLKRFRKGNEDMESLTDKPMLFVSIPNGSHEKIRTK